MNQMKSIKRSVSLFLCVLLLAAAAMVTTGCSDSKNSSSTLQQSSSVAQDSQSVPQSSEAASNAQAEVLGEGETVFQFVMADADGKETAYEIHTDKTTVGEALLELGLIAGEESEYGLYVKEVGGITADYDADGSYWAFYIDGEYASTGVDATEIVAGSVYELRVEKG